MKKTLSALLSAIIFCSVTLPVFSANAGGACLNIALASDLHYNQPREEISGDIDDEIYFYANRRAAMEDESGFIIDEFLRQCRENDSLDYVLISGDLADNGKSTPEEHYDVAAKLKEFEDETGIPVYVCNGNHDCGNNCATTNDDFREIYADFGYAEAKETLEGTLSYTVDLDEKYTLIVADSCDPDKSTEDGFTADRLNWVVSQAKKIKSQGRYPVLMMHHNLLDHMPVQRVISHDFIVRNHTLTAEKFANAGIKVVFTGHEHGNDVASYTSALGNTITDFSTTSLTMYPLEYRCISFTDDTITYEKKSIDSIDTDALTAACDGFTDEQISLMNEDFASYSKGFFKAGIKYRLTLSLSPEKLGIDENAFYAPVVYTAIDGLLRIMDMPLYGEDSVQTLASEYGIGLPETSFADGWDLATEILSYHYAGNEPYALDGPEVTLLLRVADLILLDALSDVNDDVFLKAANSIASSLGTGGICKEFTKTMAKTFGPVTAGEYLIVAIASPLLYGFAYDSDEINDTDGLIDGYAVNNNAAAVKDNVSGFFSKILLYISLFSRYILKIFTKPFVGLN